MFTVHIAGHLGKKPETRFTPSGQKVTNFSIATNHRKGKEEITVWVKIVMWGDRFDKILSYMDKGTAVIVTGRMNPPSTYTDKEGRTQCNLEVTAEMIEFSPFGKGRSDQQTETPFDQTMSSSPYEKRSSPYAAHVSGMGNQFSDEKEEEDLPF